MPTLVARSLFIPNKKYLEINLKSIQNTNEYFKNQSGIFYLLLVGWIGNYRNEIDNFINNFDSVFKSIHIIYYTFNFGKYRIIQDIIKYLNKQSVTNIVYLDHDVMYDTNINSDFQKIIDLFDISINGEKIGLLLYNQKNDNRHQSDIFDNHVIINNYNLIWSSLSHSMACGAFISKKTHISQIIFNKPISVYGLDDMYLIDAIAKKKLMTLIMKDIYIDHPYDNNDKYNKWKKIIIERVINKSISYFESIHESHLFWQDTNSK